MKLYTVIRNGAKYAEVDSLQEIQTLSNKIRRDDADDCAPVPSRIAVCNTRDLVPCEVGFDVEAIDPNSDAGKLVEYARKLPVSHDARCRQCTASLQQGKAGSFQCVQLACRLFGKFVDSWGNLQA